MALFTHFSALEIGSTLLAALCMLATVHTAAAEDGGSDRPVASEGPGLYLDVHELGPGNVTAEAVAAAHEKDLAVQGKYGVSFEKYWIDEETGTVYCLSHAPGPEAITDAHREAHGLLPARILPVTDGLEASARGGRRMFLDVHELGPGNVTAEAVAAAHEKDLAVQGEHGVSFLQYWVDEAAGTVVCLSEADSADAVVATHAEAHGLIPNEVLEVRQGE